MNENIVVENEFRSYEKPRGTFSYGLCVVYKNMKIFWNCLYFALWKLRPYIFCMCQLFYRMEVQNQQVHSKISINVTPKIVQEMCILSLYASQFKVNTARPLYVLYKQNNLLLKHIFFFKKCIYTLIYSTAL